MINGMILNQYIESYNNDSFVIEMMMENLELEGRLFILKEAEGGSMKDKIKERMGMIKEKINKIINFFREKINKMIKYITTKDKKNIIYYKSFSDAKKHHPKDDDDIFFDMIDDGIVNKEQAAEYILGMKYSDITIDYFLNPKSGIECEGMMAYNKYIDDINTLKKGINLLDKMINMASAEDEKLDKFGKDVDESMVLNSEILYANTISHFYNVCLQAMNKGLATARKGKETTDNTNKKQEDDKENNH